MLNIKRKNWLSIQEWLSQRLQLVSQQKTVKPALNLNDLVFKLATANDISEILPKVLVALQQMVNEPFTHTEHGDLLVLFSNSLTSESFLHHSLEVAPAPKLIQALHQHFTMRRTSEKSIINLQINAAAFTLVPIRLFEHDNQTVWLLMMFRQSVPDEKKIEVGNGCDRTDLE